MRKVNQDTPSRHGSTNSKRGLMTTQRTSRPKLDFQEAIVFEWSAHRPASLYLSSIEHQLQKVREPPHPKAVA